MSKKFSSYLLQRKNATSLVHRRYFAIAQTSPLAKLIRTHLPGIEGAAPVTALHFGLFTADCLSATSLGLNITADTQPHNNYNSPPGFRFHAPVIVLLHYQFDAHLGCFIIKGQYVM